MNKQDWRSYIHQAETKSPDQVMHITEEVDPAYEATAILTELEKQGKSPIVVFENIKGADIPVLANLLGSRARMALAFDTDEQNLIATYSNRKSNYYRENVIEESPTHYRIYERDQIDTSILPILTHFQADPAPYITAGLIVSADPDTGMSSLGYHRMMFKGGNRFGISLHSRKRLWDFQRRAEEKGENFPIACVLGVHPLVSLASIGVIPSTVGKYEVVGALLGEPFEVVKGISVPLNIPAYAEIVLEGEILAGIREPEGPFGEFTNYSSFRSTQHVFEAQTLYHRENPIYQSISAGLSAEHGSLLAIPREADLFQSLSRTIPGLKKVHVPISGCGLFHAYISMQKTAAGQAKQAILTALGVDHCLKLVVVVDEDVDVFNETEVLWAISTRFQADKDLVKVEGAMGVLLDPSASDEGIATRIGMDATKPLKESAVILQIPEKAKEFAKRLVSSKLG